MADVELVIKIPEKVYKSISDNNYCGIINSDVYNAIANGTPLPKGHGRLIDGDALDETVYRLNFETEESWEITRSEHKLIDSVLYEMPTIIEADEEANE